LSGIHLGLYGKEKNMRESLLSLLEKLVNIEDLGRIRLSSIEITEVSDELIAFMKQNPKMCRHLHIPLQAGTDKILKLMNRPYSVKYFLGRIKKIRKSLPDIAISTDLIVGFPGETDRDFRDTCSLVDKLKFSKVHVFSFSCHEKTPAAKMKDPVRPEVIKIRSEKIRKLSEELEREYVSYIMKKLKGKEIAVVIEGRDGDGYFGKTEFHFDIKLNVSQVVGHERLRAGKMVIVRL
jgi:threonylcarbamoyladenosine tRNA methylthiotransferase MtaB